MDGMEDTTLGFSIRGFGQSLKYGFGKANPDPEFVRPNFIAPETQQLLQTIKNFHGGGGEERGSKRVSWNIASHSMPLLPPASTKIIHFVNTTVNYDQRPNHIM